MIENMKWIAVYPPKLKTAKVVIIPSEVKESMAKVTTRELYLWGRKNHIIKRLPRKVKKRLYYGASKKYEEKASIACVNLWNKYYEKKK